MYVITVFLFSACRQISHVPLKCKNKRKESIYAFRFTEPSPREMNWTFKTSIKAHKGFTPFAVHYEKIRIHLREMATNSAKIQRVHNRFRGMRDLANFCGDIRDGSWKREREAGTSIESGSGILCYWAVGMRESQGESSGIRYYNFCETAWFDQLRLTEMDRLWMKCVGFQVMNCSRKSRLHAHVKLSWILLWCFVLISERCIKSHAVLHFVASSAFLTFPTLSDWRFVGASMISYG